MVGWLTEMSSPSYKRHMYRICRAIGICMRCGQPAQGHAYCGVCRAKRKKRGE
nr:MAG TPA: MITORIBOSOMAL PROTEIN BL27M, MRPL27, MITORIBOSOMAL, TRANSLATION, LARGE RIBOSOMAL SUBUNIT [Caudoviricetes sp.]